jgi:biopolymer transport protein ExbD
MVKAARVPEPIPFSAINVTPFIDVMLVLLIVMILSMPRATHKIPIDLPGKPGSVSEERPHQLGIDKGGALFWDGRAIADGELPALLATMQRDAAAVLHMNTDPEARYDRFDSVLAVVKSAGVERLGFVGNRPLPD